MARQEEERLMRWWWWWRLCTYVGSLSALRQNSHLSHIARCSPHAALTPTVDWSFAPLPRLAQHPLHTRKDLPATGVSLQPRPPGEQQQRFLISRLMS